MLLAQGAPQEARNLLDCAVGCGIVKCMITLSPSAVNKAVELLSATGEDMQLRVAVQPGGCSGLRYQLYFDDRQLDGDATETFTGETGQLTVAVDRMSLPYLDGAVVDFIDTIEKQGFAISNPNAAGGCACGDSFH